MSGEEQVVEGVPTSAEDEFYNTWGRETIKQEPSRLLDALQRIITLSTLLLGGSLYVTTADTLPGVARAMVMTLFLVALGAAFRGTHPISRQIVECCADDIREFKSTVVRHRRWWLNFASWSLWLGLAVAVAGAAWKLL